MKYSDERRNDPVVRAKVEKINTDRQVMLAKADRVLKELLDEMRKHRIAEDDAIYERCFDAVWSAYYRVSGDAHFKQDIGGETYIGNLAAGELGEYVVKKGL